MTPPSSRSDKMRHIKERLNLICAIQLKFLHANSNPDLSETYKHKIIEINDDLTKLKIQTIKDDDAVKLIMTTTPTPIIKRHIKEKLALISEVHGNLSILSSNLSLTKRQKRHLNKINSDLANLKILILSDDKPIPSRVSHHFQDPYARANDIVLSNKKKSLELSHSSPPTTTNTQSHSSNLLTNSGRDYFIPALTTNSQSHSSPSPFTANISTIPNTPDNIYLTQTLTGCTKNKSSYLSDFLIDFIAASLKIPDLKLFLRDHSILGMLDSFILKTKNKESYISVPIFVFDNHQTSDVVGSLNTVRVYGWKEII